VIDYSEFSHPDLFYLKSVLFCLISAISSVVEDGTHQVVGTKEVRGILLVEVGVTLSLENAYVVKL
jgi:uncharacterized membrane protein